ncbi:MAG: nucleoside 2-deoxyribosyltransferase [Nanoarchaeota archaeon]
MRKIYFAGSIRGGREDVGLYLGVIKHLQNYGQVLTEHIADSGLTSAGETELSDNEIYKRDMSWLNESHVVVAEVTRPSLGVGYEIGRIAERNLRSTGLEKKPILCLYRSQVDRRLSAMISGSEGLVVKEYENLDGAIKAIDGFFRHI